MIVSSSLKFQLKYASSLLKPLTYIRYIRVSKGWGVGDAFIPCLGEAELCSVEVGHHSTNTVCMYNPNSGVSQVM